MQARNHITETGDGPGWEHFPHGADVGIRGFGSTLEEAFAQAARAMTAAIVELDAIRSVATVKVSCSGSSIEDLLYAWLNAVVFEMATRRMVFGSFDVKIEGHALHAVLRGEPVVPDRHNPAVEVKGATYTALSVHEEAGRWIAQCVIDV